ncbi:MAG: VOC family protein [Flavobacteriaceae bacterium]
MKQPPFHLSLPCFQIEETREFYVKKIGANPGRQSSNWIDIDLFGHQITFTKSGDFNFDFKSYKFDDLVLPSFHFGLIVPKETWVALYARLNENTAGFSSEMKFLNGKKGEHRSFFVKDPNGYTLEFKCFTQNEDIFAS